MVGRTEAERTSAVESMYRIRAVESPPDAQGKRTIWHRGVKGAELVTEVDSEGRVSRHELTVFDELLVWERDKGFRAESVEKDGGHPAMPPSAVIGEATGAAAGAIDRAAKALAAYRGDDKIIAHLRELLVKAVKGRAMFEDLGEVTRSARKFAEVLPPPAPAPPKRRPGMILVIAGLALVIAALAVLLTK